jgi:hypothetical protein
MQSLPRLLFLAVVLLIIGLGQAFAASELTPKVALHVSATTSTSSICSTWNPNAKGIPCSDYVLRGPVRQPLLVYMVIAQADTPFFADGIAGISMGIEYNGNLGEGVDVISWYVCADGLEFSNPGPGGEWPASGAGNIITWLTCPTQRIGADGIHGVVGAFWIYAYSTDLMKVTPNRNIQAGPVIVFANCLGAEIAGADTLHILGCAGFGEREGGNPCISDWGCTPDPVRPATWGRIKKRY